MALIKCPECGKEVSDKAIACIHCGYPLDAANSSAVEPINTESRGKNTDYPKCPSCGQALQEIDTGVYHCSHCDNLYSEEDISHVSDVIEQKQEKVDKPTSKSKIFFALGILAIIIAAIIILPIIKTNQKYDEAVHEARQGNRYESISIFAEIKDKKKEDIQEFVESFTIELCEATQFMDASMWLLHSEDEHLIPNSKLAELRNVVDYREAEYLIAMGNYTDAYYRFRSLENYEDSANRAEEIWETNKDAFYELAVSNYTSGNSTNIRIAEEQFIKLGDYKDCAEYLQKIDFVDSFDGTYSYTDYSKETTRYVFKFGSVMECERFQDVEWRKATLTEFEGEQCLYVPTTNTSGKVFVCRDGRYYFTYVNAKDGQPVSYITLTEGNYYRLVKESVSTVAIREPAIGMSSGEVLISTWGEPEKINKSTYSWGRSEQWVYTGYRYIYLENDIVTAIQE